MTRALAALAIAVLLFGCQARDQARDPAPSPAEAADSTAARNVLLRYYAAIGAADYPSAYALWSRGGEASGQTYDEFASGFAATARTQVEFTGPVTFEGAAGSIFATVPVRIHATTTASEPQEFTGVYELRRVNDVPGATPEQLQWHIHGARLQELTPDR